MALNLVLDSQLVVVRDLPPESAQYYLGITDAITPLRGYAVQSYIDGNCHALLRPLLLDRLSSLAPERQYVPKLGWDLRANRALSVKIKNFAKLGSSANATLRNQGG